MKQFVPVNERISYIKIVKGKIKLKIVAVYFPHSGYADDTVQTVYDTLGEIVAEAKARKEHIIIAGGGRTAKQSNSSRGAT